MSTSSPSPHESPESSDEESLERPPAMGDLEAAATALGISLLVDRKAASDD